MPHPSRLSWLFVGFWSYIKHPSPPVSRMHALMLADNNISKTRRVAVYRESHCNMGSKRAFPTGVLDRWHNCLLIYWRSVAQLHVTSVCLLLRHDSARYPRFHGDRQRLPKIWVGTFPLLHFPPVRSTPAICTPVLQFWPYRIFHSRIVSRPVSSTACSTSLLAQHLRLSGLFSLELSPGFHSGPDHQCRLFQTFAQNVPVRSMHSAH